MLLLVLIALGCYLSAWNYFNATRRARTHAQMSALDVFLKHARVR